MSTRALQTAINSAVGAEQSEGYDPKSIHVLAGHAGAGATTLAAALADAADRLARPRAPGVTSVVHLIDTAAREWSGLAHATTHDTAILDGWRRGSRGQGIVVDRLHGPVSNVSGLPPRLAPPSHLRPSLTITDVGWSARELLASSDRRLGSTRSALTVVVTRSSSHALAQTEVVLEQLRVHRAAQADDSGLVVAIVQPRRRSGTRPAGAGMQLRSLSDKGAVIRIPLLPTRVIAEITPAPTPTPLQLAALALLDHLPATGLDTPRAGLAPLCTPTVRSFTSLEENR